MLSVGNVFLRTTQGIIVPVAGPTCTPLLSGLAIGPDFQMALCDVTTDADVLAMSSQQTVPDPELWPLYTAGKRMSSIVSVQLTPDTTAANLTRKLLLTNPDSPPSNYWENITVPFPMDTYPNVWCRFVGRNLDDGYWGLDGTSDFFQGLCFQIDSGFIYGVAAWNNTGPRDLTAFEAYDPTALYEFVTHLQITSSSVVTGTPNTKRDMMAGDLFVRNCSTNVITRKPGWTGMIERHPQGNNNANPWGDYALHMPMQMYSGNGVYPPTPGAAEIHAWEFVDGSVHADPFGVT